MQVINNDSVNLKSQMHNKPLKSEPVCSTTMLTWQRILGKEIHGIHKNTEIYKINCKYKCIEKTEEFAVDSNIEVGNAFRFRITLKLDKH